MHDLAGYRTLGIAHCAVTEDDALRLLADDWALTDVQLERIATERDDTFAVVVGGGVQPRYLLKIEHPSESYNSVRMRARALVTLERRAPALPITRLVPCVDDGLVARFEKTGSTRWATLTTFVPGHIIARMPMRPSPALLDHIGTSLAAIQQVLSDVRAGEERPDRILWDIRLLPILAQDIAPMINDAETLERIDMAVATYNTVADAITVLPQQLCHGDFHPGNLTVNEEHPDEIAGIIDFGDMHNMPVACDVGTALSYLVDDALDDPFFPCRITLAAFLRATPHVDHNWIVLLPAIMQARAALTILLPLLAQRMAGTKPDHYLFRPQSRLKRLRIMQSPSITSLVDTAM